MNNGTPTLIISLIATVTACSGVFGIDTDSRLVSCTKDEDCDVGVKCIDHHCASSGGTGNAGGSSGTSDSFGGSTLGVDSTNGTFAGGSVGVATATGGVVGNMTGGSASGGTTNASGGVSNASGSGGTSNGTGGISNGAGSSNGPLGGTGGAVPTTCGVAGTSDTSGGTQASGGAATSGGAVATGGTAATGGVNTGPSSTGGMIQGGASGTGGVDETGGTPEYGGGTGGDGGTGGTPGTGECDSGTHRCYGFEVEGFPVYWQNCGVDGIWNLGTPCSDYCTVNGGCETAPSCTGDMMNPCSAGRSCCGSVPIPKGMFNRSPYEDFDENWYCDPDPCPATVQSFSLDIYEVTVGRLKWTRKFGPLLKVV